MLLVFPRFSEPSTSSERSLNWEYSKATGPDLSSNERISVSIYLKSGLAVEIFKMLILLLFKVN